MSLTDDVLSFESLWIAEISSFFKKDETVFVI